MEQQQTPPTRPARTIILAFDGTTNEFDETNTNVVGLCELLRIDRPDEQIVYYQPGIGTWSDVGFKGKIAGAIAKVADMAVAWGLEEYICAGYKYLMDNHETGDRICIFGFSRGAYTARAFAGMLHKVGLLGKDNEEQVSFAYKMYAYQNHVLAAKFKRTFCKEVMIDFLGVWDTVASVGILIPHHLPFISNNTIKIFRHAVSLDERRARFTVTLWNQETESVVDHAAESKGVQPVKEVWFAGDHGDVGGGNVLDDTLPCMANVPFRWMLHEIVKAKVGVLFDPHMLERNGIPTDCVPMPNADKGSTDDHHRAGNEHKAPMENQSTASMTAERLGVSKQHYMSTKAADKEDVVGRLHDSLTDFPLAPFWWLVQIPLGIPSSPIPALYGVRRFPGDMYPPPWGGKGTQFIHPSVKERMLAIPSYRPKAILPPNWESYVGQ